MADLETQDARHVQPDLRVALHYYSSDHLEGTGARADRHAA